MNPPIIRDVAYDIIGDDGARTRVVGHVCGSWGVDLSTTCFETTETGEVPYWTLTNLATGARAAVSQNDDSEEAALKVLAAAGALDSAILDALGPYNPFDWDQDKVLVSERGLALKAAIEKITEGW